MKEFKVGDDVFDIRFGKGKVTAMIGLHFPLQCTFDHEPEYEENPVHYERDGKDDDSNLNPVLMHLDRAIELGLCKREPYKFEAEVEWTEHEDGTTYPFWSTPPYASLPQRLIGKKGKLTFVEDVE